MLHALQLHFLLPALPMADTPTTHPALDFPGSVYLIAILDIILGAVLLALSTFFFVGVFQIAASFLGKREGGAGKAVILCLVSIIGLVIVISGTVFLNQWIQWFRGFKAV